jgi:hypothetical protein
MEDRRQNSSDWEQRQQEEDAKDTAAMEREKFEQSQKDPDRSTPQSPKK